MGAERVLLAAGFIVIGIYLHRKRINMSALGIGCVAAACTAVRASLHVVNVRCPCIFAVRVLLQRRLSPECSISQWTFDTKYDELCRSS